MIAGIADLLKRILRIETTDKEETVLEYPEASLFMRSPSSFKMLTLYMNIDEILTQFFISKMHFLPIYVNNQDAVIGCYSVFDAIKKKLSNEPINLDSEKLPANFLVSSSKIDKVLHVLSTQDTMVILVDEHGGTEGVITTSILMEKIYSTPMQFDGMSEIVLDGQLPIEKILSILQLPQKTYKAKTCGGFIIEYLDRIPGKLEKINIGNYDIFIQEVKNTQILRIQIKHKNQI